MRYAELMTSLSMFKGTVHMNQNSIEKCGIQVLLLHIQLEI